MLPAFYFRFVFLTFVLICIDVTPGNNDEYQTDFHAPHERQFMPKGCSEQSEEKSSKESGKNLHVYCKDNGLSD